MISYQSTYGVTSCPAIFSDHADFGSLSHYRTVWCGQETCNGSSIGISEPTIWKLFKDMILALDFLHNRCGFIHRDVKSENILVYRARTEYSSIVPKIPTFKLGDFSRAAAYPPTDNKVYAWAGTVEFAPPLTERQ
nr:hypothetical protein [Tanacetum cinerariifolium]